jgi:hypothetical protein
MSAKQKPPELGFGRGIVAILVGVVIVAIVLGMLGREAWQGVWLRVAYRPVEAVVGDRRLAEHGTRRGRPAYRLEAWLTYEIDGREYQGWVRWGEETQTSSPEGKYAQAILDRVGPGERVPATPAASPRRRR